MAVSVQALWIIYIVSLILLAVVFGAIWYKTPAIGCSCGILISTILSALLVYLIAIYNINLDDLSSGEKASLNALYITILVLIVLAFFFCIVELALKGTSYAKNKVHAHIQAVCDSDGNCDVTNVVVCDKKDDGSKTVTTMNCTEGECSPTNVFLKGRDGSSLNIQYLA